MKVYGARIAAAMVLATAPACAWANPDQPQPSVETTASAVAAVEDGGCELHVWPTDNYIGLNTGLLSGFGVVGALADMGAHAGRVQTVKDLMREYLGPDIQLAELERVDIVQKLKLEGYRVIVEDPTPFNEDLKNNPELKARLKASMRRSRRSNA